MQYLDSFPCEVNTIENIWVPMSDGIRLAGACGSQKVLNVRLYQQFSNIFHIVNGILRVCVTQTSITIMPDTVMLHCVSTCAAVAIRRGC